ncbi:MAG: tetratricopeptide repeat protein [Acidobacteriota bacterium]|nr:MAG: tetratricopeptide repeat protein [Acidobacteriota bacterium]
MAFVRFSLFVVCLTVSMAGCSWWSSPAANSNTDVAPAAENPAAKITDANEALTEGSRLLEESDVEAAILYLERAVEINPDLGEAYFKLGIAYGLQQLQATQAGIELEPATDDSGKPRKTSSERAFEKAIEAYKKWIKENPKDDVAFYNMGRAYAKLMEDKEAEDAFKKAVAIKPDDPEYQMELGAIRIKLANYAEAIAPLKKSLELDPENVRADELLEEAEAGRRRVEYVSPKGNTNTPSNTASNTAANSAGTDGGGANTSPKPPAANSAKTQPPANRPASQPTPNRTPARPANRNN